MTARELVTARGGDWCGVYGLVPGPGHSPRDRSLKVWEDGGKVYVHSFAGDDWRDCRDHLGLDDDWQPERRNGRTSRRREVSNVSPAKPTARVRDLLRTVTTPDMVPDAIAYLKSRNLWPLPPGCTLKAHPSVPYWDQGERPVCIGQYPALVAEIRGVTGEVVTAHVTYLQDGRKIEGRAPRKILSGTSGRAGCAVRLVPPGPVLAVAEGIETALAANTLLQVPVWACLNTSLLSTSEPPAGVERLVIAADRDVPGLVAAWKLRDRLGVDMELRMPRGGDFADDLEGQT